MARKRISEPEVAVSQGTGATPVRRKTAVTRKKHTPATSVAESLADPAVFSALAIIEPISYLLPQG